METQPKHTRRPPPDGRFEYIESQFDAVVNNPEPIQPKHRRLPRQRPGAPSKRAVERRKWRESRAVVRPARELAADTFYFLVRDLIRGPDDLTSLQDLMAQAELRSFNNAEARARKCHDAWLELKKQRLERGGVKYVRNEEHAAIAREHFTKTPQRQLKWKKLKYHSDPEYRQRVLAYNKKRRDSKLQPLGDLVQRTKKGALCPRCGFTGPTVCFDFHHRAGTDKDFVVSSGAGDLRMTIERLQREIDKCDLVCANCHRIIHAGV